MNGEICLKWLKHFSRFAQPLPEKKVLLLVDGHSSHKSLEVLEYAKHNNIILFCFPPHCTHRLQPLDVTFYGPLTSYYNQAIRRWLVNNPGRTVTHYQVGELFKEAYEKAATVGNATSGFLNTGIVPLNPNIFPEWMFSPSITTDIPIEEDDNIENVAIPSTSTKQQNEKTPSPKLQTKVSVSSVSDILKEITPMPIQRKTRNISKKGKLGVINNTPDIIEKKEEFRKRKIEEERKAAKRAKKNINTILEDSDEEMFPDFDDNSSDAACLYCNELYSNSKRKDFWIRCQMCSAWCHTDCAGVDKRIKLFTCDLCQS